MKDKTIRRVDEMGRVVIPAKYRIAVGWGKETKVCITKENNQIILKVYNKNFMNGR